MSLRNPVAVKVTLLGESGAGKSSLVLRQTKGSFQAHQETTIGAAYVTYTTPTVKLEIWDTAGQERYASLAPMYYRNALAVIVVFDVTSVESFNRAQHWLNEVRSQLETDTLFLLVGNKIDLKDARVVSEDEARTFAQSEGCDYFETSARENIGVNGAFGVVNACKQAMHEVFDFIAENVKLPTAQQPSNIVVTPSAPASKPSSCC